MTESFFSRWSRRKSGKEKEVDSPEELVKSAPANLVSDSGALEKTKEENQTPPLATFEDVEKIDRFAPDFSAFMKPGVDPAVQQAALKKMFTDPHFNVMDGLDIYIDDYSKPDPLPQGMLERMVQSDMLNLFRKKPEVVVEKEGGTNLADSLLNPENHALESESKTDLTSSHIRGSNESINEATSSRNPSSELEQKKT
ncbi:DUF3306 domain-containing protein [Polynucleobacter sp. MWH-UH23A]|uniref:DUF3306 domain-containing protein n=1 Tax=Polynucleobacter sp. MWH-UH23A TaxID=1855613 RepID=UPI003364BDBA